MHEPPSSPGLTQPSSSRSLRLLVAAAATTAVVLAGSALGLSGCAADLARDPMDYQAVREASGGSGAGGSSGGGSSLPCDITTLFNTSCGALNLGCHGPMVPASMLDLVSPGAEARLLNQSAKHMDIVDTTMMNCPPAPSPELLVDGNNPDNSWILKKVNGMHNSCGAQMPPAPFPAPDMTCLRAWVFQIAGKDPNAPATPGGGTGGMPATGGTGGGDGISAGTGGTGGG